MMESLMLFQNSGGGGDIVSTSSTAAMSASDLFGNHNSNNNNNNNNTGAIRKRRQSRNYSGTDNLTNLLRIILHIGISLKSSDYYWPKAQPRKNPEDFRAMSSSLPGHFSENYLCSGLGQDESSSLTGRK